jgi:hypothetical protein
MTNMLWQHLPGDVLDTRPVWQSSDRLASGDRWDDESATIRWRSLCCQMRILTESENLGLPLSIRGSIGLPLSLQLLQQRLARVVVGRFRINLPWCLHAWRRTPTRKRGLQEQAGTSLHISV